MQPTSVRRLRIPSLRWSILVSAIALLERRQGGGNARLHDQDARRRAGRARRLSRRDADADDRPRAPSRSRSPTGGCRSTRAARARTATATRPRRSSTSSSAGKLQFKLGDEVVECGRGTAIRVAPEVVRSVWNDEPEDAELVIVSKRVDRPAGRDRLHAGLLARVDAAEDDPRSAARAWPCSRRRRCARARRPPGRSPRASRCSGGSGRRRSRPRPTWSRRGR